MSQCLPNSDLSMTQKKYFFYNSKTLQFEEVKTPFLKKLLKYGSVLSLLTIYIWLTWSFFTPKFIKEYIAQKSFLKKRIQKSNKDLDQMTFALNSLMTRDNDLYRSKLELNKIDESTWEGGVGGVERNPELQRLTDSKTLVEMSQKMSEVKHKLAVVSESQDVLIAKASSEEHKTMAIPLIRPVLYLKRSIQKMSGFGMRRDPFNPNVWQMHYGIDFAAPTGTPIFATGNGVVARIEHKANGYGLNVVVDHGFGYKTLYAHMSSIATTVGKKVKRGEIIGFVGSTGHSTAPHLHYEIFKNDTRVNPSSYCSNMTTEEYKSIIIAANGTMSFAPKNSRKRKRR